MVKLFFCEVKNMFKYATAKKNLLSCKAKEIKNLAFKTSTSLLLSSLFFCRCVEVEIAFTVDNQESQRQTFSLHNTCPGRQLHNEDKLIPDLPRKTLDCTKSSLDNGGSSPIQERSSSKYGKKNSNAMKIY